MGSSNGFQVALLNNHLNNSQLIDVVSSLTVNYVRLDSKKPTEKQQAL